ncbi:MAG TPA: Ig-like domain-containing protein [Aequorivita sp.]|nr:Ig-like domain-containing protein [Aequorivita sp.]
MKHRLLYIPILLLFLLSFTDCAKKGTPSGGPRDTIPPVILRSNPENYNTLFTGDEIEIRFDEYIKLKDIGKELIISPPMKYAPIITPLSTSKTLKIKLVDTLKPNTTYVFNFGNSIVDNNEGNVLEYFKYVFSTGDYIDSLKLSGRVRDAELVTAEFPTTVMLYEMNEAYTDSLVYSEKPMYITVTKDSTGIFEFTNLKEGEYKLLAVKEKNNTYTFQPKDDKIGFITSTVSIPSDSTYSLTLFKETPEYKLARPNYIGKDHIVFGYEGEVDSLNIRLLSEAPKDFESISYKDQIKDSIHYWFKPSIETDTLLFEVAKGNRIDTAKVRLRELYRDSLTLSLLSSGTVKLKDTLKVGAKTPLVLANSEKVEVMALDSTFVDAEIRLNRKFNQAEVYFPKAENGNYRVILLPGALTDFYGKENDSMRFNVRTRSNSDYGSMLLNVENINRFPVIVQLVNENYKVIAEDYLTTNRPVNFDEIMPNKYYLRIIYDDNKNGKWDTGNYLKRIEPEKVIYYPSMIDVRANWSLNEIFKLK